LTRLIPPKHAPWTSELPSLSSGVSNAGPYALANDFPLHLGESSPQALNGNYFGDSKLVEGEYITEIFALIYVVPIGAKAISSTCWMCRVR